MFTHTETRSHLRKLARQGRMMDEAFKHFQRAVYPGAPASQVHELRTTFMAGAAELIALMTAAADDTPESQISDDEEAFTFAVFAEVERFHRRTVDLAMQKPKGRG